MSARQDRQPLLEMRQLNCAGTAWYGVVFSPERSREFLQELLSISEGRGFQAELAAASQAFEAGWKPLGESALQRLWRHFEEAMPDYGCEATAQALEQRLEAAQRDVERLPGGGDLAGRVRALLKLLSEGPEAGPAAAAGEDGGGPKRPSLKRFLLRHGLGPPGGFDGPGSESEEEAWGQSAASRGPEAGTCVGGGSSGSTQHGQGGLCEARAMLRRLARVEARQLACEAELEPICPPITLFTRPTCSVTLFSNAQQLGAPASPYLVRPEPLFAVALSSATCSKGGAAQEWELLKQRLVPVLQATVFHLLEAARRLLPRPLGGAAWPHEAAGPRGEAPPLPWKRLGQEAFRRGDFYTAARCFAREVEELTEVFQGGDGEKAATALSNRAACWAKVGDYAQSLEDARSALALRPAWGRAWSRVGHAASRLGQPEEASDAYLKAVQFDPSAANVEALCAQVGERGPDAAAAHAEKEKGNVALLLKEFGEAVARFSYAIALLPPHGGDAAADEHAFLRAVLFSNRAGAFARLKDWGASVADGEQAVAAKPDFPKAHSRLGTALLGMGLTERAYAAFAQALRLEGTDQAALRGRTACLGLLPMWRSQPARRRLHERFGADRFRPPGSTRVYAVSDLHYDHKCNEEWAHRIDDFKFQEDVLIVAGNMCDTRVALARALTTLKAKFRRVFYVPGNHEHWMNLSEGGKYPDSLAKLLSFYDLCDELGVDMFPAAVAQDVFVVPLLSWYSVEFDQEDPFPDPVAEPDKSCRWPIDASTQVWKYMLKLNEAHLRHPYHSTVISFSHFLPLSGLPFASHGKAAKAMGCEELNEQVKALGGAQRAHVYGHASRKHWEKEDGVIYVNHHFGEEAGREERAPLLLLYDGKALGAGPGRETPIYDGPTRT